jgi:hypothetical protein
MKIVFKILLFLLLFSSCDSSEDPDSPLTTLEDAQAIAASLNALREAVIAKAAEVHPNNYRRYHYDTIYSVYLNALSGYGYFSGIDSAMYLLGNTTRFNSRGGKFILELNQYSNIESITLSGPPALDYFHEYNGRILCATDPYCPSTLTESSQLTSSRLEVSMSANGRRIRDVLEINFSFYMRVRKSGPILVDSVRNDQYSIKTARGEVFEW